MCTIYKPCEPEIHNIYKKATGPKLTKYSLYVKALRARLCILAVCRSFSLIKGFTLPINLVYVFPSWLGEEKRGTMKHKLNSLGKRMGTKTPAH